MNAMHDPITHKFPPEIGSYIFLLSLPKFKIGSTWPKRTKFVVGPLRLGAVCRTWRQLAWATPHLWETLNIAIKPPMRILLAKSLPDLVREWLDRSGRVPLTILFDHLRVSYGTYSDYTSDSDNSTSNNCTSDTLEVVSALVIEILNLHSGRWRNLYLNARGDIFQRFSGSIQPTQLVDLGLILSNWDRAPRSTPTFSMKSEPNPTRLKLFYFPLTSIHMGWENITHATFCRMTTEECIEFLRRATALEHYDISIYTGPPGFPEPEITPILHPHLHSFRLQTFGVQTFVEAITLPSLKEWTQEIIGGPLPMITALSFLDRSRCCLKALNVYVEQGIFYPTEDLNILLQAIPSLERLQLSFHASDEDVMDDILTQIFCSTPGRPNISGADKTPESFLPNLQFLECSTSSNDIPFSWNRIPQLYRQGHRRSLVLKSAASKGQITDETALELLQLVDEGVAFQIFDKTNNGDFLENYRNSKGKRSL